MTWSPKDASIPRREALWYLLDTTHSEFTRSLAWRPQSETNIPLGVWTMLYDEGLIQWHALGGNSFRLTTTGWIRACHLLRADVDLDNRFGVLSAHLKGLNRNRVESWVSTSTQDIAESTGLPTLWVYDAIKGQLAELIYHQHGAKAVDEMGGVEVWAHVGNPLP